MVKKIHLQCRRLGFYPWVGKSPLEKEQLPNPVLLPGESHAQRSLAGYNPWGCKASDMTERLSLTLTHLYISPLP